MTTRKKTEAPEPEEATEGKPEADVEEQRLDNDLEALNADPSLVTLSDGREYRIDRLKTRGALKLLKIFTAGASDVLMQTQFSPDMSRDQFTGIFLGALIVSIPEQENETLDFIQSMVKPKHLIKDARTPQERESNEQMLTDMYLLLEDAEIEDSMAIITAIATIEAPHILSLGKQLTAVLAAQRAGRAPKQTPTS